ncbi:MAG TPA: IS1 family transposase [Candidatus Sulfotelmatobacter sp.]
MNTLSTAKKLAVISSLLEGNSVRSTERMTGVHRDTICRLLVETGDRCNEIMDSKMRNLRCGYVQCDEIWTYCGKKQRRIRQGDSPELGDQWVFVAIDAESKLVPVFTVGKRTEETTWYFVNDLAEGLANRIQLTCDGFVFYRNAVEDAFGAEVDFAQLIKMFGDYGQRDSEAKYSPNPIKEVISRVRCGDPDPERICTSHVERQNLTMRMAMRRFTRLTNGFSKKLTNLKAACALHFAHYNFCRVHSSLRVTSAMAAGISSEIWPLERLLS